MGWEEGGVGGWEVPSTDHTPDHTTLSIPMGSCTVIAIQIST